MRISILCSDSKHPVYTYLSDWCEKKSLSHEIELVSEVDSLTAGDLLFLISCTTIITTEVREKYISSLVVHASDLPNGRGWSPLVWQVLEGRDEIIVSLIEAADPIDSGKIWGQRVLLLEGHELVHEINNKLFDIELELMDYAIDCFRQIKPKEQKEIAATYYRKRVPEDSRVDPEKTISSQFDLLRVCDPERYPAFFEFRGCEYEFKIFKRNKSDEK